MQITSESAVKNRKMLVFPILTLFPLRKIVVSVIGLSLTLISALGLHGVMVTTPSMKAITQ